MSDGMKWLEEEVVDLSLKVIELESKIENLEFLMKEFLPGFEEFEKGLKAHLLAENERLGDAPVWTPMKTYRRPFMSKLRGLFK